MKTYVFFYWKDYTINIQMINSIVRFDHSFKIALLTYEFSRCYKEKQFDL